MMACGVLEVFTKSCEDSETEKVLLQKIPYYDRNCLEIADEGYCLKFVSLSPVQNLITFIWSSPKKSPTTAENTTMDEDDQDKYDEKSDGNLLSFSDSDKKSVDLNARLKSIQEESSGDLSQKKD